MAIYGNSRYRGVKYTTVKHMDGSVKIFLHARKHLTRDDIKRPLKVRYIREDDMLDSVAHVHAKDESKWWIVADINEVLFPLEVGEGDIFIPDRTEFAKLG